VRRAADTPGRSQPEHPSGYAMLREAERRRRVRASTWPRSRAAEGAKADARQASGYAYRAGLNPPAAAIARRQEERQHGASAALLAAVCAANATRRKSERHAHIASVSGYRGMSTLRAMRVYSVHMHGKRREQNQAKRSGGSATFWQNGGRGRVGSVCGVQRSGEAPAARYTNQCRVCASSRRRQRSVQRREGRMSRPEDPRMQRRQAQRSTQTPGKNQHTKTVLQGANRGRKQCAARQRFSLRPSPAPAFPASEVR